MTLVVKIPLSLELIRFLTGRKVLYPVHPSYQLHLLLSLFASMGETCSANKGKKVFDMGQFDFS